MEWMHAGVIFSYGSCLRRVVLAVLMGVGVVAHVYLNTPSPKWLIYMTDQVLILSNSLLDNNSFPGNHLASYPLRSSCLSGPLGKVQVVVWDFRYLIPGVQSLMAAPFLSSISSPGVLRWPSGLFVKYTLPSEHGVYHCTSHLHSLLDPSPPNCCGVWLSEGVAFLPRHRLKNFHFLLWSKAF